MTPEEWGRARREIDSKRWVRVAEVTGVLCASIPVELWRQVAVELPYPPKPPQPLPWSEADFTATMGHAPHEDDLERVNCERAGTIGHHGCGVCLHGLPKYACPECFAVNR